MKKFLILCLITVSMFFCLSASAKEPALTDLWPDFMKILPWDPQTGEWRDERAVAKDGGENPEKGRMEENEQAQKDQEQKELESMEKEEKGKTEEKPTEDIAKKAVKSIDIIMILDKSGSMYNMRTDTIGGFNSFLDEQRKKDIPIKVSVGLFNQALENKFDRIDLKDVPNLTDNDYTPQGTTAMLDAIGNTLSAFSGRAEVNAEGNKVLVVIITDGMENASKEWTWTNLRNIIRDLKEQKGYEFVFLGADIDAERTAENIGIQKEASMKFKKTGGRTGGVQSNFKAINVMMESMAVGNSLISDTKWKDSVVEDKN